MEYDFKNAAVYPFGYEFLPMLSGLCKKKMMDSSVKLVSPKGWGFIGKDAGRAFGRPDIGINVTSDIKNAILDSDTFVAIPFKDTGEEESNNYINGIIDENINYAISMNKKVIDLRNIEDEIIPDEVKSKDPEIDCPIIFVDGMTEQLNKLDIMMDISNSLSAKGYRISQIGTRYYCNVIGMHSFPQFMFSTMNERDKINTFKSYVYNIYQKENPDVIIIGIPGAAIPFNDKVDNEYGIIHYMISMAIKSDFTVTCSNLQGWDFEKLNIHFTHRFGHGINCVVLTNTKILYNPQEFPDRIFYEIQDYQAVDKYISEVQKANPNIPLFNEYEKKDIDALTELVIDELSDLEYFKV